MCDEDNELRGELHYDWLPADDVIWSKFRIHRCEQLLTPSARANRLSQLDALEGAVADGESLLLVCHCRRHGAGWTADTACHGDGIRLRLLEGAADRCRQRRDAAAAAAAERGATPVEGDGDDASWDGGAMDDELHGESDDEASAAACAADCPTGAGTKRGRPLGERSAAGAQADDVAAEPPKKKRGRRAGATRNAGWR